MKQAWSELKAVILLAVFVQLGAHWVAAQSPPLILTKPVTDGNAVIVRWSGGAGPYLLQRQAGGAEAAWANVTATTELRAVIPNDSDAAFFRLVDRTTRTNSTNSVLAFSAWLTGSAERPVPLTNSASGFGSFYLDGSMLTYRITYAGLSGSPAAAHIHGTASTSQTANALYSIGPIIAGTAGTLTGHVTLSAFDTAFLMLGRLYVNIQTAANPNGEFRGQIAPIRYLADLRGTNEIPVAQTNGRGDGQFNLVGNQLWYEVNYTNLASNATGAHIHGPATNTQNADVMQAFVSPSGTSGKLAGKLILTDAQLAALIDWLSYVNIQTTIHGEGEIRGRILPFGLTSSGTGGTSGGG